MSAIGAGSLSTRARILVVEVDWCYAIEAGIPFEVGLCSGYIMHWGWPMSGFPCGGASLLISLLLPLEADQCWSRKCPTASLLATFSGPSWLKISPPQRWKAPRFLPSHIWISRIQGPFWRYVGLLVFVLLFLRSGCNIWLQEILQWC